ncbi:maleylacetoacetate isomerase [Burkholderia plantarii]|uniref:maleylacetoacetate isomerase n=1 Tax=Burkholderia plantarii TaxID=41899 RepID=UPI001F5BF839|nr:maleylacetoacetate isomerase [Burkholderia plantarii]
MITLHGFQQSSASFRVRIALNLKGVQYETRSHDLSRGEHRARDYLAINPQGLLPSLEMPDTVLTQSLAIIEYLDARYPDPPLLPEDRLGQARVRALSQLIAADTHPVTSMRVANYLKQTLRHDDSDIREWRYHWFRESFGAFEALLEKSPETGRFCYHDQPTLADIALVPQVFTARRLGLPFDAWPTLTGITDACMDLPAFSQAYGEVYTPFSRVDASTVG